eukprot:Gb_38406 [translate_table: standard]
MPGRGLFENMPGRALPSKFATSDVGRRLILANPLFVLFPSCGCNGTFGMRCVPGGGLFENMARFTPRFRRVVALSLLLPFPCSIVNWLLLDGVDGSREGCAGGAGHPSGVSYGILLPGACEPKAGIVLLRLVFAHPPPPPTHEYVPAPYAILLPRRPVNPNARSPRSFSPSDHLPRQVRSSLKCYNAVWSGSPWLSPLLHNVARGMRPSLNHLYRPPACLPPASPPLSLFSRLDPNAIAYVQENMISPFCSTHLFIPVAALPLDPAERDDFVESDAKRCPPNQFDGRLVSCCTASGAPDESGPIVLAFGTGVMINRDGRGHSYFIVRAMRRFAFVASFLEGLWPFRPWKFEAITVSASHQLALTTSLPFVHTARRSYRLNDPVKCSDRADDGGSPPATSREVH